MLNRTAVPLLGVLILLSSPALASTWYVNGVNGDDGNSCKTAAAACATIGHAISLAASGDTIQIAAATYQENLSIPFDLTLNGAAAATTIVDGTNSLNVFTVGAGIRLSLSNLTIERGVGYQGGGGVDNAGTLVVNNSLFNVNTALSGGAILNTGTAHISNTSFNSNSPYFFGHSASCGAIDNRSTMTITASTFYNNYCNNNFTSGGAICNVGTLTILDSTFSNNASGGNNAGYGGAIFTSAGTLTVTNSTFSGNSATTSGGAIYSQGGTVQISNSTFGNNPETIGGGGALSNAGGAVTIQNSIVANTANGGNCDGTVSNAGYNVANDASCGFGTSTGANGQTIGDNINPLLDPSGLQTNGGPTQTIALQAGSPAIDAVPIGQCPSTDQRGLLRPDPEDSDIGGAACDIGAFEANLTESTTTSTSTTTSSSTITSTSTTTSTTLFSIACEAMPVSGCQPAATQKALLRLRKGTTPAAATLLWKWVSSGTVDLSNFGNPSTTTDYLLCLYDAAGEKFSGEVPAGGTCGTNPCWKALGTVGFKYAYRVGTPNGLTKVLLKAGTAGKGKIGVQGADTNLAFPTLPLTMPVRAQLRQSGSSACWEATYGQAITNSPTEFKAKSE